MDPDDEKWSSSSFVFPTFVEIYSERTARGNAEAKQEKNNSLKSDVTSSTLRKVSGSKSKIFSERVDVKWRQLFVRTDGFSHFPPEHDSFTSVTSSEQVAFTGKLLDWFSLDDPGKYGADLNQGLVDTVWQDRWRWWWSVWQWLHLGASV